MISLRISLFYPNIGTKIVRIFLVNNIKICYNDYTKYNLVSNCQGKGGLYEDF
jgi:hypothetical protein